MQTEIAIHGCDSTTVFDVLDVPGLAIERPEDLSKRFTTLSQLTLFVGSLLIRNRRGDEEETIARELGDSTEKSTFSTSRWKDYTASVHA